MLKAKNTNSWFLWWTGFLPKGTVVKAGCFKSVSKTSRERWLEPAKTVGYVVDMAPDGEIVWCEKQSSMVIRNQVERAGGYQKEQWV